MNIQHRASTRARNKPHTYTPAKYQNFNINKDKALNKKLEACNRPDDLKSEEKHGNYILELSAAAYEILRSEIDLYFDQHSTYKAVPQNSYDGQGLCIRTSTSIKNRSSNRQMYRINLFHTTSRVEINGHSMEYFITHIDEIKERMKTRGNYRDLNKQIEEQINMLKTSNYEGNKESKQRNNGLKALCNEMSNQHDENTDITTLAITNSRPHCNRNEDEDLQGWIRPIELMDNNEGHDSQNLEERIIDMEQNDIHVDSREIDFNDTLAYITCGLCDQPIQPDLSIDCTICNQSMHYTCENMKPGDILNEKDYICKRCCMLDEDNTDPKQIIHAIEGVQSSSDSREIEVETVLDSHSGNISQTRIENSNTNEKTIYITPTHEIGNTQNDALNTRERVVDTSKSQKIKSKKPPKSKENSNIQKQLEGQLNQCKAHLVIMEDTNRDYKNTINLLRMQLEKNDCINDTKNNSLNSCNCNKQSYEHIANKMDRMMTNLKWEMENREIKFRHHLEMSELKTKIQLLEMQNDMRHWNSTQPDYRNESPRMAPPLYYPPANPGINYQHTFAHATQPNGGHLTQHLSQSTHHMPMRTIPMATTTQYVQHNPVFRGMNQGSSIMHNPIVGQDLHYTAQTIPSQSHHPAQQNQGYHTHRAMPTRKQNHKFNHDQSRQYDQGNQPVHLNSGEASLSTCFQQTVPSRRDSTSGDASLVTQQSQQTISPQRDATSGDAPLTASQRQPSPYNKVVTSGDASLDTHQLQSTPSQRDANSGDAPLGASQMPISYRDAISRDALLRATQIMEFPSKQGTEHGAHEPQTGLLRADKTEIDTGQKDRILLSHSQYRHNKDSSTSPQVLARSGGDAPPDADCHQMSSSQRVAEADSQYKGGEADRKEQIENCKERCNRKPNHFLDSGRSNRIKGRKSL